MTDSTRTIPVEPPDAGAVDPAGSAAVDSPATAGQGLEAIQTWTAPEPPARGEVPISRRTGEPTRVWTVWLAAIASYLAVAVIGAATFVVYWRAAATATLTPDEATGEWRLERDDSQFMQASWLMGQFDTEPGSLGRVLLAVAVTLIAVLIGVSAAITGYYAYDGRDWTRWAGLIAFGVSLLALMVNPIAWAAIGLTAVAAAALWLPATRRYFAAWSALRHKAPVYSEPPEKIWYGPLPKYR